MAKCVMPMYLNGRTNGACEPIQQANLTGNRCRQTGIKRLLITMSRQSLRRSLAFGKIALPQLCCSYVSVLQYE